MQIISNGAYGRNWPEGQPQFVSELQLYSNDKVRSEAKSCEEKHVHLKKAINLVIPSQYLVWHRWLDRALESFCYDPIVSEWGASGMGKSSDYGLLALFDVLAAPSKTLTVLVTNPLEMHMERCFKYANLYHSLLPKQFQWLKLKKANPLGLLFDFEKVAAQTGKQIPERRTGIICFSNKPGDSFEDLKRRIGAHEERMRLFVDEPQGCSNAVLNLKINMSAGAGVDYRERFLGNPSGRTDPLGKHSQPKDKDWKKTEHLDEWETSRSHKGTYGKCFVRDGTKSPANEDPKKFFFLYGPEDIKDAKRNYGENSQEFWTYARGRLLGEGANNVAITEPDLEDLDCFREVIWTQGFIECAGLDAAGQGRDGNKLYRIRCGKEVEGRTVATVVEKRELKIDITKPDKSGQIAKQVVDALDSWDISLEKLAGDVTGNQGPIFDAIEREWQSRHKIKRLAYRVEASGKCSSEEPIFEGSNIIRSERFFNRATELFFNVVMACQKQQLILHLQNMNETDSPAVHQLTTRQLVDDAEKLKGKIQIEPKEQWRARNSGKSPDDLDGIQQALAYLIEQGHLRLNEGASAQSRSNHDPRKQKQRPTYSQRKNRRSAKLAKL